LPLARTIDEKAVVNAIVGLLATGGSTNHTMHLVAMARCAGISITWDDFSRSVGGGAAAQAYLPQWQRRRNRFQMAGGMAFLIRELLGSGYLHADSTTVMGAGLRAYSAEPWLDEGRLSWRPAPAASGDLDVLRPADNPFSAHGGLKLLTGNLGRSVIKTSAMKAEHHVVEAPAVVFEDQGEVIKAFKEGRLSRDGVVVVRFQGPRANGMPELHKLTPSLASLQSKGFQVRWSRMGRMSGAPAACRRQSM